MSDEPKKADKSADHPTKAGKVWKCETCGAHVKGLDWDKCVKGKSSHPDPKGGTCRAVNLTLVGPTAPDGVTVVEADNGD